MENKKYIGDGVKEAGWGQMFMPINLEEAF